MLHYVYIHGCLPYVMIFSPDGNKTSESNGSPDQAVNPLGECSNGRQKRRCVVSLKRLATIPGRKLTQKAERRAQRTDDGASGPGSIDSPQEAGVVDVNDVTRCRAFKDSTQYEHCQCDVAVPNLIDKLNTAKEVVEKAIKELADGPSVGSDVSSLENSDDDQEGGDNGVEESSCEMRPEESESAPGEEPQSIEQIQGAALECMHLLESGSFSDVSKLPPHLSKAVAAVSDKQSPYASKSHKEGTSDTFLYMYSNCTVLLFIYLYLKNSTPAGYYSVFFQGIPLR